MRKKLLALMMCATMVLSTATTAMAGVSDDAKKMYEDKANTNYDLFMDEYFKGNETIVKKVWNSGAAPDVAGEVEYGFVSEGADIMQKNTPKVVYSKDGEYFVATEVELKTYVGYETADRDDIAKRSDLNGYVGGVTSTTKLYDKGGVLLEANSVIGANYSIYAKDAKDALYKVVKLNNNSISAKDTKDAVAATLTLNGGTVAGKNYVVDVKTLNEGTVKCLADNAKFVKGNISYVTGTQKFVKVEQKKADGKSYVLLEGRSDMFTSADGSKVWTCMSNVAGTSSLLSGLVEALNTKVLTKNAVVVKMDNYVELGVATDYIGLETNSRGLAAMVAPLYNATKLTAGSYTFDSDLFSRTGLKDEEAINVFKMSAVESTLTSNYDLVRGLEKIATVKLDETVAFDSAASWSDGMFIFDKGDVADLPTEEATTEEATTVAATEAATEAPAETTTTAQASLEKAPQMGDTTPIAALAVVMMGAVGAMVVASKKRA